MVRRLPILRTSLCALLAAGCVVHTYQPMSGLHRPVIIDPQRETNFDDLAVQVTCVPKELLSLQQASALCQKVGVLFENQGALVTTSVGGPPDEGDDDDDDDDASDEQAPRDLLRLELRARQIHQARHPLTWAAMLASFTLVPAFTEFTFEQDVVVRDGSGSLLATDTLRGRVVHYYGFGAWFSNKVLDWTVREDADEVVGDHADRALSDDLYRQLSQTVFNAKIQQSTLRVPSEARR